MIRGIPVKHSILSFLTDGELSAVLYLTCMARRPYTANPEAAVRLMIRKGYRFLDLDEQGWPLLSARPEDKSVKFDQMAPGKLILSGLEFLEVSCPALYTDAERRLKRVLLKEFLSN